jgi:hypothetical protein
VVLRAVVGISAAGVGATEMGEVEAARRRRRHQRDCTKPSRKEEEEMRGHDRVITRLIYQIN